MVRSTLGVEYIYRPHLRVPAYVSSGDQHRAPVGVHVIRSVLSVVLDGHDHGVFPERAPADPLHELA
jgi:hypothetical protein